MFPFWILNSNSSNDSYKQWVRCEGECRKDEYLRNFHKYSRIKDPIEYIKEQCRVISKIIGEHKIHINIEGRWVHLLIEKESDKENVPMYSLMGTDFFCNYKGPFGGKVLNISKLKLEYPNRPMFLSIFEMGDSFYKAYINNSKELIL